MEEQLFPTCRVGDMKSTKQDEQTDERSSPEWDVMWTFDRRGRDCRRIVKKQPKKDLECLDYRKGSSVDSHEGKESSVDSSVFALQGPPSSSKLQPISDGIFQAICDNLETLCVIITSTVFGITIFIIIITIIIILIIIIIITPHHSISASDGSCLKKQGGQHPEERCWFTSACKPLKVGSLHFSMTKVIYLFAVLGIEAKDPCMLSSTRCDRDVGEGITHFFGERRGLDRITDKTILEKRFETFQVANCEEECSMPEV
ncbi:hypothetical protein STEG23_036330, partial [Scotinomys teguina]